jgi:protein-S-isoprenylcysteine O-methyltransferase Ste14
MPAPTPQRVGGRIDADERRCVPVFGWWMEWEPIERPSVAGILLATAWGILLLGVAGLILVRPEVVAFLAAGLIGALGAALLGTALAGAWDAWRHRPRRIKIRVVR